MKKSKGYKITRIVKGSKKFASVTFRRAEKGAKSAGTTFASKKDAIAVAKAVGGRVSKA